MDDDDKLKSESRPSGLGPGERLQAARIQKSLSIDDVAGRMHLSTEILEAIEENRFEEITAPIFVKGYLRAYARIVALDEDEIIQQYVDSYSKEDPPISTTSNMAPELSVADVRIKWTTYLVIVILAALLAAWWWNKKQAEMPPMAVEDQQSEQQLAEPGAANDSQDAGSSMQSAGDAIVELPVTGTPGEESTAMESAQIAPDPVQPAEPEPAPPEAEAIEPATAPTGEPEAVAESVANETTAQIALAEAGQNEAVDTDSVAEQSPAAPASINTPRLVAPGGSDRLEVVVNADTWADIKDASDFQMVYDLLRAGQTLELTGRAPFSVFLGNGHGVEIRFNDEEIEFSARIRDDNTTRLRVGG